MSERPRKRGAIANPVVIGAVTVLVVILGVFLAYNANSGLPFVPRYTLHVNVRDAGELTKNAEVHMAGGSLVGYLATKQALAHELLEYLDRDAPLFKSCRSSLLNAGQPVLDRAQQAGVVRADITLWDIIQMVGGIAKIQGADPAQIEHILGIALDGLRYRPA